MWSYCKIEIFQNTCIELLWDTFGKKIFEMFRCRNIFYVGLYFKGSPSNNSQRLELLFLSPPHLPRDRVWERGFWTTFPNTYPDPGYGAGIDRWRAEIRVTTPIFSGRYESSVVMTRWQLPVVAVSTRG